MISGATLIHKQPAQRPKGPTSCDNLQMHEPKAGPWLPMHPVGPGSQIMASQMLRQVDVHIALIRQEVRKLT